MLAQARRIQKTAALLRVPRDKIRLFLCRFRLVNAQTELTECLLSIINLVRTDEVLPILSKVESRSSPYIDRHDIYRQLISETFGGLVSKWPYMSANQMGRYFDELWNVQIEINKAINNSIVNKIARAFGAIANRYRPFLISIAYI